VFVPAYRLYGLDGSGKIDSAEWLEADDDEAAIVKAHARFPDGAFELWHGQQLIACGRAGPPSSSSPDLA
jgi:hypothetical protein